MFVAGDGGLVSDRYTGESCCTKACLERYCIDFYRHSTHIIPSLCPGLTRFTSRRGLWQQDTGGERRRLVRCRVVEATDIDYEGRLNTKIGLPATEHLKISSPLTSEF